MQFIPTTGSLYSPGGSPRQMCLWSVPSDRGPGPQETELCPGAEEGKEGGRRRFFSDVFVRLWSLALKMPLLALLLQRY